MCWLDPLTNTVIEVVKPNTPPPRAGLIVVAVRTVVKLIDPVFGSSLVSGRVTIEFNPGEIVTAAGWYGEFGVNPNLPAPAIGADPDIALLQTVPNAAMASSRIVVDQARGRAVFEFNWGPAGFVPSKNLDATGHFNFAGLYLAPQPGTSSAHVVGGLQDILANGVNASTYLLCNSPDGNSGPGFCGSAAVSQIPEPSVWTLIASGLLTLAVPAIHTRTKKRKWNNFVL
jgi:hypothetical protein